MKHEWQADSLKNSSRLSRVNKHMEVQDGWEKLTPIQAQWSRAYDQFSSVDMFDCISRKIEDFR